MKYEKFLPIGSVVLLKNGSHRVMITGFCCCEQSSPNVIYDYVGCLYPEGYLSSNKNLMFNHDQINKIYYMGFSDDEEKKFKENLNNIIKEYNNKA